MIGAKKYIKRRKKSQNGNLNQRMVTSLITHSGSNVVVSTLLKEHYIQKEIVQSTK